MAQPTTAPTLHDDLFNGSHTAHIETHYEVGFIALSGMISYLGVLCAVFTMREYPRATTFKQQMILLIVFTTSLGGQGIWAMHFCALYALRLHFIDDTLGVELPIWDLYRCEQAVGSLGVGFVCILAGSYIASRDPFFSKDVHSKAEALSNLVSLKQVVKLTHRKLAFKALFAKLQYIVIGGIVAGTGTSITHFLGVDARHKDHYEVEYNLAIAALSVVISISQFIVGYWLVFRFLQWKPRKERYRLLSAAIMSTGCLSLHYVAMEAAIYKPTFETGPTPDGLLTGHSMFFYTMIFAFLACAVTLFALIQYITYFSMATELEKEMDTFVTDLTQRAHQKRDPATTLKDIKILLGRYAHVFETLNESGTVKSYSKGVTHSTIPVKHGVSNMMKGHVSLNSGISVANEAS